MTSHSSSGALRETAPFARGPASEESPPPSTPAQGGGGHPTIADVCRQIDEAKVATDLAARMRAAADALEEVSTLYGYLTPPGVGWSPAELRAEAKHVEAEGK